MTDIRAIESGKYNSLLASALKESSILQKPEWVDFVKTSTHKMRPVSEENFWEKRAASILRQIYVRKIVGVQRLRTRYGGRKNRGAQPAEFRKGGGKIVRTILQQLESAGLVEKNKEKPAGRKLTEKGVKFMEEVK